MGSLLARVVVEVTKAVGQIFIVEIIRQMSEGQEKKAATTTPRPMVFVSSEVSPEEEV